MKRSPSAGPTTGTCTCATARCCGGRAVDRAAVRARHRDAEPGAAGDRRSRRRGPIASASSRRCRQAADFTPLMTCYLTDSDRSRRDRARLSRRACSPRSSSTRRTRRRNSAHGVTDHRPGHAGAGADGGDRHAAADPRRGDRPRGRRVRPRGGVHRARARPAAPPRCPSCEIVLEHVTTEEAVALSSRAGGPNVAATITAHHLRHQPQRDLRGRHPAASLLPADRQAREAPPRAAPRRDLGQPALLPRHRQRAARDPDQGDRLRLRRHLHRAGGARDSMPRCSTRRARSTASRPSPR